MSGASVGDGTTSDKLKKREWTRPFVPCPHGVDLLPYPRETLGR